MAADGISSGPVHISSRRWRQSGLAQPADKADRDRVGGTGGLPAGGYHGRLDEPGHDRRPAGGGKPDQPVDGTRSPQGLGDHRRHLGLAARAWPVRQGRGERRIRKEGHRRTRDQDVGEGAYAVRTVGKAVGERGNLTDAESPRRLSWDSHWASPPATPIDAVLQPGPSQHLITREGSGPENFAHISASSRQRIPQVHQTIRVRPRRRCWSGSGGRLRAADRRAAGPARSARGPP